MQVHFQYISNETSWLFTKVKQNSEHISQKGSRTPSTFPVRQGPLCRNEFKFFFSRGTNHSKDTLILIKSKTICKVEKQISDKNGRYILLDLELADLQRIVLVNIYVPNDVNQQVSFFKELQRFPLCTTLTYLVNEFSTLVWALIFQTSNAERAHLKLGRYDGRYTNLHRQKQPL